MRIRTLLCLLPVVLASVPAYAGIIWSDGFEGGLGNWTFTNPSGDGTAMATVSGGYTSSQGTVAPPQGLFMAQISKDNGGLAQLASVPIALPYGNNVVTVDVYVGGLGMWDNCGFRWNKWGTSQGWVGDNFRNVNPLQHVQYQVTPTSASIQVLLGLDRSCRDGLGHSAFFDEVIVSQAPEPATLALLGLGALTIIRRRRA